MMTNDVMPETKFVDSPHGRIAYQEAGQGPTVILIHGGGPGAYGYSNYRKNLKPLADRGNHVVIIDLPGYGQSDYRQGDGSMFMPMAQATLELIDHLGVEKASLVGNSLGGGTSLRTVLDAPDRVEKLVLMGPAGSTPITTPFPTEGALRMFDFYENEGPTLEKLDKVIDLLVYDRSAITPALMEERLRTATLPGTMANPPLRGRTMHPANDLWKQGLEKITQSTLLIWGKEDRVVPFDSAFVLMKLIPNADLHVFSKCGHWAQWERAEEFNDIVGGFLAQ
ncbi:MAG: alpha/beta fold hydrolase [Sphingobium sp.]